MKGISKNFFLISFLPAIAYWYLESYYEPRIAVIGGLVLALVELSLEKIFVGEIHTISKFNFYLIFLLGGLSFLDNKGIWFKLQPAFTGVGIGVFLIYKVFTGKGMIGEMMESFSMNRTLPPKEILLVLEKHIAIFFFCYGVFMGLIAVFATTGYWTFFKTAGFYLISFIFMFFEIVWMRFYSKRIIEDKHRKMVSKF